MSGDTVERLNAALEERYRVDRELGEGGMATVYLAEDLKHSRKVALKVLRPELAAVVGGERFLAEIETTANLQHPHILPLFDSGEADGFLFYVMPYVEGESLRDRVDRDRQLPVDEAVEIARKVGSALQYAHEQGVIHRDIKPANILMSRGEPLVADFGIALALSEAGAGRITETGLSLGTPHYMSPEQAAGERGLDVRSDVYALGCVLYEMLAGQPPYGGPTAQSVLAQILTEEPRKVTDFRRTVPAHVAAVVMKSLEKLPADRFTSVEAFQKALKDEGFRYDGGGSDGTIAAHRAAGGPTEGEPSPWIADPRSWAALGVAAILAVVAGVQMVGGVGSAVAPGPVAPAHRFALGGTRGTALPAVSVDGAIAFTDLVAGEPTILIRFAGETESRPLPGTEGGFYPAFSPNGEWIVFTTGDREIKKIPTVGGPVVTLTRGSGAGSAYNPHWGDDGTVVFWADGGLFRVPDVGGDPEMLLEAADPAQFRLPHLLPGGRGVTFTELALDSDLGTARIQLLDLETREVRTLVSSGADATWSPTGHLLYGHESGALFAAPFDLGSMEVTGPGVPVLDSLLILPWGDAAFGLSASGTAVYQVGSTSPGTVHMVEVDPSGERARLPLDPSDHLDARYSPDGRFIAYIRQAHVYIYDTQLGTNARFTFEGTNHHDPVWSPDGEQIVFTSARDEGDADLWIKDADGGSPARRLGGLEGPDYARSWSEEGTLVFSTATQASDIYTLDLNEPDAEPEAYLQADWTETRPALSPDGRWLAYLSTETGQSEVFVRTFPEPSGRWQVSQGTAVQDIPRWGPDSRTLYYHDAGGALRAADLATETSFAVTGRRELFRITAQFSDIHPTGDLFLFGVPLNAQGSEDGVRMIAVANWFTELRTRLGLDPQKP